MIATYWNFPLLSVGQAGGVTISDPGYLLVASERFFGVGQAPLR